MGRRARAAEALDPVQKLSPRHPVALMDKGVLRSRQGEHDEALDLFNRALEADPSFALAAFNRASALSALGRFDEAVTVYNIALGRRPDLPDAWYFKGRELLESGQPQAAVLCLEEAGDLRRPFWEAHASRDLAP